MNPPRTLWYFADPLCSWCWGFAPVISAIREQFADRLRVELIMGGLRPGTTDPVTPAFREEILHHWQEVHRRTGQPFRFDGAMPDGFVYDTEPPSRAVVAVADIQSSLAFPFFKSVQTAFYADGQDVTQASTLAEIAERSGIGAARFLARFNAEHIEQRTRNQFRETAQAGVRGFPTVVMQDETGVDVLTAGYRSLEELQPRLDAWTGKAN